MRTKRNVQTIKQDALSIAKAYDALAAYNAKLTNNTSSVNKTTALDIPVLRAEDEIRNRQAQTQATSYRRSRRSTISGSTFNAPASKITEMPGWLINEHFDKLQKYSIGDWYTWSMTHHTSDEIRERLITKPITDTCISYVCRGSRIDPDFMDEFIILSTGYFHAPGCTDPEMLKAQPIEYNPISMQYYKDLLNYELGFGSCPQMPTEIKEQVSLLPHGCYIRIPSYTHITDRIDWLYISQFQKFPRTIWAKYYKRIKSEMRMMPTAQKGTENGTEETISID